MMIRLESELLNTILVKNGELVINLSTFLFFLQQISMVSNVLKPDFYFSNQSNIFYYNWKFYHNLS